MDSRQVVKVRQRALAAARGEIQPRADMLPAAVLFLSLAAMLALGWFLGNGCGDVVHGSGDGATVADGPSRSDPIAVAAPVDRGRVGRVTEAAR